MKKIIVTNTGDTTVMKTILQDKHLDVVVVTEERFADAYPEETRIAFVTSLNDPYRAAEEAQAQIDLSDREYVVSLSERAALTAGCLRSWLSLPGPNFDVVLNCTNKYVMKKRFNAVGLQTAKYHLASNVSQVVAAVESLEGSAVIKPVMGAGSDAMMVVRNDKSVNGETLESYLDRIAQPATTSQKTYPLLVESLIPATSELHCDGYVQDGKIRYARVSRYLRPVLDYAGTIFGSYTLPDTDPVAREVLQMHALAVSAVGLTNGPTHFEVLDADGELFAGEIASRPGGGGIRRMLQLRDGFDSRQAMVLASLGERYSWSPTLSEREIAQFMLPSRRGTVTKISTPEEMLQVASVLEADIRLNPGEEVGGLMDSSSVSGLVFAEIPDTGHVLEIRSALAETFTLELAHDV